MQNGELWPLTSDSADTKTPKIFIEQIQWYYHCKRALIEKADGGDFIAAAKKKKQKRCQIAAVSEETDVRSKLIRVPSASGKSAELITSHQVSVYGICKCNYI